MMKYFCFLSLLILLSCTKAEIEKPHPSNQALDFRNGDPMEDFYADFQITYMGDPVGLCGEDPQGRPILRLENQVGVGTTNLQGEVTGTGSLCADPYFLGDPSSVPGEFLGEITVTGASGDAIVFEALVRSYPNPKDETLSILKGNYTILGGTGQFEGAEGKGKIRGTGSSEPDPNIPALLHYDGKIRY